MQNKLLSATSVHYSVMEVRGAAGVCARQVCRRWVVNGKKVK